MKISLVVAAAENGAIGKNNQLLWRLSADLQRFKQLTTGHHILMGRKTYNSIGKPLPNRTNIIISKDTNLQIEGAVIFDDLLKGIEFARQQQENELFIIGGGTIYTQAMPLASNIYLTEVAINLEGDTYFTYQPGEWNISHQESFPVDEKNEYPTTYKILERK